MANISREACKREEKERRRPSGLNRQIGANGTKPGKSCRRIGARPVGQIDANVGKQKPQYSTWRRRRLEIVGPMPRHSTERRRRHTRPIALTGMLRSKEAYGIGYNENGLGSSMIGPAARESTLRSRRAAVLRKGQKQERGNG